MTQIICRHGRTLNQGCQACLSDKDWHLTDDDGVDQAPPPNERLEYLRQELRAGTMSYGELAELQDLADQIDPGDVELLEAAGVPEFPVEHRHVWGPLGYALFGTCHRKCLVAGCTIINALDDRDEWCHQCGAQFMVDDNGTAMHVSATTPDGIDHDADADHVAYSLPDNEEEN